MNAKQRGFVMVTVLVLSTAIAGSLYDSYIRELEESDKLQVVATFYPLAYFAERIGGGHVNVLTLIPENSEAHTYDPSISDILETHEADVLLYNGAGLDDWFTDKVLAQFSRSGKVVVDTTADIELHEQDEDHEHHGHDHGSEDPHTWISPHIAVQQAETVYDALVRADPDNENNYSLRWTVLRDELEVLDAAYTANLTNATVDEIIVSHAAFGYLADRYGFEQHGVIGLSGDEQPSLSTMISLSDMMEREGIYFLFVDPVFSDRYVRVLEDDVERRVGEDVRVLKLYFMLGKVNGKNYIEQMETNLKNLAIGLGVPGTEV